MLHDEVLAKARVLIVDDEEANSTLFLAMLNRAGFAFVEYESDPRRVLAHAQNIHPNLIVLDLQMPGISGFDILADRKNWDARLRDVPILVCTADSSAATNNRALAMGASDFVTKPIDRVEFVQRAHNLIETHVLQRQLEEQNFQLEGRVRERTAELQEINRSLETEIGTRKETEAALKQTEQRLRFLFASGPASIYSFSPFPPYEVTFVSENIRAQMGCEPEEFLANPAFRFERVHADDRARIEAGLQDIHLVDRHVEEYQIRHRNGSDRWIQDDVMIVRDHNGEPLEAIGAWIDVSERKWAEEALAEHARDLEAANLRLESFDRMKSEFVATASHEMRTPLTVIRENASQIRDGVAGDIPPEQDEMMGVIMRNCDRLGGLLDNLLDLRKIEAGQMALRRTRVDPATALQGCYEDFSATCSSKGIDLVLEAQDGLAPVLCDPGQINQLLINLLGNAVKFTPAGGRITLSASAVAEGAEFAVQDTGKGIDKDNIDRVFEAFCQVDRIEGPGVRGTGLGLTICKRIAEMHSTDIRLASSPGTGSRFSFLLPAWDEREGLATYIDDRWKNADNERLPATLLLLRPTVDRRLPIGKLSAIASTAFRAMDDGLETASLGLIAYVMRTDIAGVEKALLRLAEQRELYSIEYSVIELTHPQTAWGALEAARRQFKGFEPVRSDPSKPGVSSEPIRVAIWNNGISSVEQPGAIGKPNYVSQDALQPDSKG